MLGQIERRYTHIRAAEPANRIHTLFSRPLIGEGHNGHAVFDHNPTLRNVIQYVGVRQIPIGQGIPLSVIETVYYF